VWGARAVFVGEFRKEAEGKTNYIDLTMGCADAARGIIGKELTS